MYDSANRLTCSLYSRLSTWRADLVSDFISVPIHDPTRSEIRSQSPFCSLVTALSNGQKSAPAEHKDAAAKLTFDLLGLFFQVRRTIETVF